MNIIYKILCAIILCLHIMSLSLHAANKFHPRYRWYSIQTRHFWIHYHEGLEQQACALAKIAEQVHEQLRMKIRWEPYFKTDVVLCDTTDMANGFSMPFPYNRVQMYIVLPEVEDGLMSSDEWLLLLFIHEYTHTLTIDMIDGIPEMSRYTFGRVCFPNSLMPAWAVEGYPVVQESMVKPWGRLNARYTMMILRQEVYSKNLKDISLASNFPRIWPAGMVPYLYGGLFVDYCNKKFPWSDFSQIYWENADNILPFLMEKNFDDVYGQKAITLWKEWQQDLSTTLISEIETIKQRGVTPYTLITNTGFYTTMPRFMGNSIVYVTVTNRQKPSLNKYTIDTGTVERLTYVNNPKSISIRENSVLVCDIEFYQSFDLYNDVFIFDQSYKQKTHGLRVHYIEPYKDGYLAIIHNKGKYSLVYLNPSFTIKEYLIKNTSHQISYLRVFPEKNKAVFTLTQKGFSDIVVFDTVTKEMMSITDDAYIDIHPVFHPDGTRIVFSSDRDGVFNLYEANLQTKQLSRITNLIGGAFFPDISQDGSTIVFSSYESNGYNIALMKYAIKETRALSLNKKILEDKSNSETFDATPYNPLYSLIAPWWWPFIYTEEILPNRYDTHVGFYTSGYDTLFRHSYSFQCDYAVSQKQWAFTIDYIYSGLYPDVFFTYKDVYFIDDTFPWEPPDNVIYVKRTTEQKLLGGFSIPYNKLYNYNLFVIYYTFEKERIDEYMRGIGIGHYDNKYAGVHGAFVHDSTYSGSFSVSKENGMVLEIFADVYHKYLASDIDYSKVRGGIYYFINGFANDILAIMVRGGYAWNVPAYLYPYNLGRYAKGKSQDIPSDEEAYSLRGFAKDAYFGNRLLVAVFEYRIPLFQRDWAYRMFPIMFRDLWLVPFVEYGNVWIDSTTIGEFKYSIGSELHIRITAGYYASLEGFVGIAKGYGDYGQTQIYFGIATVFEKALPHYNTIRKIIK